MVRPYRKASTTCHAVMIVLAAVAATGQGLDWDPDLDTVGAVYEPASPTPGQYYWRLVKARYENEDESGGTHHIYFLCQNAAGTAMEGVKIWRDGPDGSFFDFTKGAFDGYWGNMPMWGGNWCPPTPPGPYAGRVDGISDRVSGMGMPCNRHVNYRLWFQYTLAEEPPPGAIAGAVRDPDGVPVTGASVSASPGGASDLADGAGAYRIDDLEPGEYAVTAARTGYHDATVTGVIVTSDATTTADIVLPPRDSDGDEIHDPYESDHPAILDPGDPDDAALDPDRDRMSNLAEYRAGTDPESHESRLQIVRMVTTGSMAGVEWTSAGGRDYVIQTAPAPDGEWTTAAGPYSETRDGEHTLQGVVTLDPAAAQVYLRVELE